MGKRGPKPGAENAGRPRSVPEEVSRIYHGAPIVTVRVPVEVRDWIKEQGGSAWLRRLLEQMYRESEARRE